MNEPEKIDPRELSPLALAALPPLPKGEVSRI